MLSVFFFFLCLVILTPILLTITLSGYCPANIVSPGRRVPLCTERDEEKSGESSRKAELGGKGDEGASHHGGQGQGGDSGDEGPEAPSPPKARKGSL